MNNDYFETALSLAERYVELNPREEFYRVDLLSCEDDSEGTYYHSLSEEEKAIIRHWRELEEDDEMYGTELGEYLELQGKNELAERLIKNNSEFELDLLHDCDPDDMLHFMDVEVHIFDKEEEEITPLRHCACPMDDDDYATLLAYHIMDRYMTMNKLYDRCPELMQRVNKHLLRTMGHVFYEVGHPFFFYFRELDYAAKKIMDPHIDYLGIYESDDEEIVRFAKQYIFRPDTVVLVDEYDDNGSIYCMANIVGKTLQIDEDITTTKERIMDKDMRLALDAEALCKHLRRNDYQDLVDYFKEKYNKGDVLNQIESDFAQFVVEPHGYKKI